jgi:hypothetical protein
MTTDRQEISFPAILHRFSFAAEKANGKNDGLRLKAAWHGLSQEFSLQK